MKTRITLSVLATLAVLAVAPVLEAEGRADKNSKASMSWGTTGDSPKAILERAVEAHKAFKKGSPNGIPTSLVEKAECIAIIPGTVTAAAVVGGTHGDGVAVCRTNNQWSKPAFVDLDAASLGAQVGAKSSDVVLYLTSQKAAQALKRGSIEFGADASVVAGNFERSFDISGADVVAYQNSSGAFVGASIGGGKLTSDDDTNSAFYGKKFQAEEILNGKVTTTDSSVDSLVAQITK